MTKRVRFGAVTIYVYEKPFEPYHDTSDWSYEQNLYKAGFSSPRLSLRRRQKDNVDKMLIKAIICRNFQYSHGEFVFYKQVLHTLRQCYDWLITPSQIDVISTIQRQFKGVIVKPSAKESIIFLHLGSKENKVDSTQLVKVYTIDLQPINGDVAENDVNQQGINQQDEKILDADENLKMLAISNNYSKEYNQHDTQVEKINSEATPWEDQNKESQNVVVRASCPYENVNRKTAIHMHGYALDYVNKDSYYNGPTRTVDTTNKHRVYKDQVDATRCSSHRDRMTGSGRHPPLLYRAPSPMLKPRSTENLHVKANDWNKSSVKDVKGRRVPQVCQSATSPATQRYNRAIQEQRTVAFDVLRSPLLIRNRKGLEWTEDTSYISKKKQVQSDGN